jgi:signal transduction histidine kinase
MRSKQIFSSLRFKAGIGVIFSLVLILSLFSYLQYTRRRQLEIKLLEQSATNLGQMVEGSLRHAMLAQDHVAVQQMVDDMAEKEGVESILVINMQREIRYAPHREGVGTSMSLSDPGCQVCHAPGQLHSENSNIIIVASGQLVLRNCNPVQNEPACTACHDAGGRLNGVIITDLSMAMVERNLAAGLRETFLLLGGALAAGVLTVNLVVNRLVVGRLALMAQVVKAFGQGDFGQRVLKPGTDEIGQVAATFNQMAQGLQDKAALEEQVSAQEEDLRRLSEQRRQLLQKTISAQEEERKRLARELHDEWAQTLAALTVNLEQASQALPDDLAWLKERLERSQALTVDALKALRRLILDLRPTLLDDLGLVPAIRWYAETRLEAKGMAIDFQTSGSQRRLPPEIETALFRIAQEAINNIEKHANAALTTIHLDFQIDRVVLSFQDDGQGLEVEQVLGEEREEQGWGLLGMRERAALLGGSLNITSEPGRGTRIQIEVPVYGEG